MWLQTLHELEDQQEITLTHKCAIIKYNVHSFNVPFPRTVPGSSLRLSHSQCNPSPSLSLSTHLTHMKCLHWTIRHPSNHPVFPHLTIRQSQLSSDANPSIKSHCESPVHYKYSMDRAILKKALYNLFLSSMYERKENR